MGRARKKVLHRNSLLPYPLVPVVPVAPILVPDVFCGPWLGFPSVSGPVDPIPMTDFDVDEAIVERRGLLQATGSNLPA